MTRISRRTIGAGERLQRGGRLALLAALVSSTGACAGTADRGDGSQADAVLALVGGTIYIEADSPPIRDGALLIRGERIVAVGPRDSVDVPARAVVLDMSGRTVLPGFWNSHVHLTEPKWQGGDTLPAEHVTGLLRDMLLRYGFVHVFDIASFPEVTLALRRRIASGEVAGPDILTTLVPFVPPNGTPRYVAPLRLPELHGAREAVDSVRARVAQGADGIKLFTVPITQRRPFPVMDPAVVSAVADEARRNGLYLFAHPTNLAGIDVAVRNGVDVLAHTAPMAGALPDSLQALMLGRGTALIPTLTLWEVDVGPDTAGIQRFVRAGQEQVRAYAGRGGPVLFGTDVGYIDRYDPTREYELMAGAGLDFNAILASLTTAPAAMFRRGDRTGRLRPDLDADVVVVEGDPVQDIRALSQVRLTVKRGRILFQQ